MTAAQAPAPQAAPAPAAQTAPPPAGALVAPAPARGAVAVKEKPSGTPRTMAILSGLSIVSAVLFALLGAFAVNLRADALVNARLHSEQLVRIQTIHTEVVKAAAGASNEYLSAAGPDATSQRQAFTAGVANASKKIAEASAADPDDAVALATVNDKLAEYTGLIESARANNRQGYPAGRAYLKTASDSLTNEVLPELTRLVSSNDTRVQDSYVAGDRGSTLLWLIAALAFVVLSAAQAWLLLRTHRILNVGLAAATAAIVVATIVSGSLMAWAQDRGVTTRDGPYAATLALAQARIAAFDAKSLESLALIKEGNGQADETTFTARAAAATAALSDARTAGADDSASAAFAAYRDVHVQIRQLDDNGKHQDAVNRATTQNEDGANKTFDRFVTASNGSLETQSQKITDNLEAVNKPLLFATGLVLLAGLLAAVASWWGFAKRLEEYR